MSFLGRRKMARRELPTLPEDRRATLHALELAATLAHFGNSVDAVEDERSILAETAVKMEGLLEFSSLHFFLANEVSSSFDLVWTSAPDMAESMLRELAVLIEDRTFAWALGRNKPSAVTGTYAGKLLLHPLTTASGPLGMFVGCLDETAGEAPADIGYYLLTVTLFASATMLENFRLFRHLETANARLEEQVGERTRELTLSNTQLRETLEEKEHYRQNLEAVFSSMQDPLVTVDRTRRILSVNKAGEGFFGAAAGDLVDKPVTEICGPMAEACLQVFASAIDQRQTVREFRTQYRHEGMDRVLILSCSPLISAQGSLDGAVLLIRDITRLASLERQLKERHAFRSIIGKSQKMQQLYALLENLAEVDTTVLVTGESGTGKELVADALHHNGARAGRPLIKVNCTALSESLLESELFGHVRGAFTGAHSDKAGRFEAAAGGTIFLDEIGDVSPRIQILLLRFLGSREFERVGDTVTRKADVRIVAATNADLPRRIREGAFRADLYYRLNVMHVHLPPLRERRDDIPLLTNHFIELFNRTLGTTIQGITDDAMQFFMRHPWSGNVRELRHAVEHACILARKGLIGMEHLTPEILSPQPLAPYMPVAHGAAAWSGQPGGYYAGAPYGPEAPSAYAPAFFSPGPALHGGSAGPGVPAFQPGMRKAPHSLTRQDLAGALKDAGGNKALAARLLGIGRATLYRKLRDHGLS